VSGGALLAKRPGLKAVIERMRCGQSDGVVVRAYERFMRSVRTVVGGDRADRGPRRLRHIGRLFAAQGNVDFQTPTGRMLSTQVQSLRSICARTRGTSGRSRGPGRGSAVSGSRDHRRAT
jgi:hypothetical protein